MNLRPDLFYIIVYGPGYGESVLLRAPGDTWVVIDACLAKGKSSPATLLNEQSAEWSCVVLTHPHSDHARGLEEVIEHDGEGLLGCAIPRVEDPGIWTGSPDPEKHDRAGTVEHVLAKILDRWELDPSSRWLMKRGDTREVGDIQLEVLHPVEEGLHSMPADPNRVSTAMRVAWGHLTLLLGSDVVHKDWEDIASHFADLSHHNALKFPHHGSEGAVHTSWGDGSRERLWIMTPFNCGRAKLPKYGNGHGLEWALRHVNRVCLTGLPLKHKLQGKVPYETTRAALFREEKPPVAEERIGRLRFHMEPEPSSAASSCFVAAGFDGSGVICDLQYGPGAVVVREDEVQSQ